jgi:replicative DNA helicase
MSNNLELALITRVIDDADFHSLEKAQITEEYFSTPEAAELFRYLRDVYHSPTATGMVPSRDMVKMRFQGFYPFPAADPVPVLAQELRRQKVRLEIAKLAQDLQAEVEHNPLEAMATLRAQTSRISALAEVGQDMSMSAAYSTLMQQYEMVAAGGGLLGIPYPWHPINEETQGMQPGQFIVFYARPKNMKSWIAIYIGVYTYLHSRRRVLYYTREMSPNLVAWRTAACMAKVSYKAFKNGRLQPELKQHAFGILQELMDDERSAGAMMGHQPDFKIVSDHGASGSGGGGVSWLRAKIREFRPDLVIVDGMYLMKDDRDGKRSVDWKNIAHISQDLKLTAQEFNIPLIGVTQANRGAEKTRGEDLTELAYADALGQDADAVFRLKHIEPIDEQTKKKRSEIIITAPGLREGKFEGIIIAGEPATDFQTVKKVLTSSAEADEYEDGEKKQSKNPSPAHGASASFRGSGPQRDPRVPLMR